MRAQNIFHAVLMATALFASAGGVALADHVPGHTNDERCQGKSKKGCEVPEVPYTAILPAAAMAGAAGFYLIQRRRSATRAEATVEGGYDR